MLKTAVRTSAHLSEIVYDDGGILAGCTCGWTCSCLLSDQTVAYGVIHAHFRAVQ